MMLSVILKDKVLIEHRIGQAQKDAENNDKCYASDGDTAVQRPFVAFPEQSSPSGCS